MSQKTYIKDTEGKARLITKLYAKDNSNKARKVSKLYVRGADGLARLVYSAVCEQHVWGDVTYDWSACSSGSVTASATCTACGVTLVESTSNLGLVTISPATCTSTGLEKHQAEFTQLGTAATCDGHTIDVEEHNMSNADCTKPATCSVCGHTEGNALGHTYGQPTYTWASSYLTCTATATCTTCGDELTEQVTPTYKNNSEDCTTTGFRTYTAAFPSLGTVTKDRTFTKHSYGTYTYPKPTCTTAGTTHHICTQDGCYDSYTTTESALGHEEGNWEITVEAGTCSGATKPLAGTKVKRCTRTGCGEILDTKNYYLDHNLTEEDYGKYVCTYVGCPYKIIL